ncbi:hypothetical protein PHMEG_00033003, partial [Phytophthora megakarya]
HWQSDDHFHRIPEHFAFPQLDALGVWRLWWLGNPASKTNQRPERAVTTLRRIRQAVHDANLKRSEHISKQRAERVVTTLCRIRQAVHDANQKARTVPFRNRKRTTNKK